MKFPKVKKKLKKKDSERNCYNCKLRFSYYGKEGDALIQIRYSI